jgi:peptide/nickel transport system ATP-binding protein
VTPALEFRDLVVDYRSRGVRQVVLRGISLAVAPGEAYGLVGESGCGKSTAALAAMRALPGKGAVRSGQIRIGGEDVMSLGPAALRDLRRTKVSMVYQDPGRALNPTLTVARQVAEVYQTSGAGAADALARAEAMLARVRIPAPGRVMNSYPYQLSGGMQQRVVIAMALAKDPALLVLDEPTTALDATVEADVLDLVAALREDFATAILFISHNLAVIGRMCDRVGVLYGGCLVEEGAAASLLARPMHPYTARLLQCRPAGRRKSDGPLDTIPGFPPPPGAAIAGCVFAPRCELADARCRAETPPMVRPGSEMAACFYAGQATIEPAPRAIVSDAAPAEPRTPVLRATRLSKTYRVGGQAMQAVRDVSLALATGETLGLVGESGSGKTTLARLLLGLVEPDAGGGVALDGEAVSGRATRRSRATQKALQILFQNPDSALNRSHTVRHLIGRPLRRLAGLSGVALEQRLAHLLGAVRLTPEHLAMRPRQLSGGLKQRVAIARAFAGDPLVVICDEPTSALDVSVQAAILNLLAELQASARVSYLFISHDLDVVRYLSDRIAVMYLGRIVLGGPHHPYTEALLSAVPDLQGEGSRIRLAGDIPSPLDAPRGCVFSSRCPRKFGAICETVEPALSDESGHAIRCHLPRDQLGRAPATHGEALVAQASR